jgi:hypothetical protein
LTGDPTACEAAAPGMAVLLAAELELEEVPTPEWLAIS